MATIDDQIKNGELEDFLFDTQTFGLICFGTSVVGTIAIERLIHGDYRGAAISALGTAVFGLMGYGTYKDIIKDYLKK